MKFCKLEHSETMWTIVWQKTRNLCIQDRGWTLIRPVAYIDCFRGQVPGLCSVGLGLQCKIDWPMCGKFP